MDALRVDEKVRGRAGSLLIDDETRGFVDVLRVDDGVRGGLPIAVSAIHRRYGSKRRGARGARPWFERGVFKCRS